MHYKRMKLSLLFLLGFGLTSLAQESISATGGNASGSGGSASYSVGQLLYQTHHGTTGSISEGVQQPYEISIVTGMEEAEGINLVISAYPNPATDYLHLAVESGKLKNLSFQLYNMSGELLQSEKITSSSTSILMSHFVPATYFLKVVEGSKEVKTFKVIKSY